MVREILDLKQALLLLLVTSQRQEMQSCVRDEQISQGCI